MTGGCSSWMRAILLALVLGTHAHGSEPRVLRRAGAMREGPGSFFPVVAQLEPGAAALVTETRGAWVRGSAAGQEGWLPLLAFQGMSAGVDYAGMLDSEKAVVISSVDIAAATKGAFEANYAETHKVDFARVDTLEHLHIPPALVSRLTQSLPVMDGRMLQAMPRPVFRNNVIILPDAERLLGRALTATLVSAGFVAEEDVTGYVNAVASLVGAKTPRYDLPFRVAVTADDSINGFGLPGGNVVLTRGLLRAVASEAELACQIGHEIAHITLYHGLREFEKRSTHRRRDSAFAELETMTGNGGSDPFGELNSLTGEASHASVEADLTRLANTSYLKIIGRRAREDEFEADLFGAAYAAAAGYDPNAMLTYLERVRDLGTGPDAFRHHPSIEERIGALREGIRRFRLANNRQVLHRERFAAILAALDGGRDAE